MNRLCSRLLQCMYVLIFFKTGAVQSQCQCRCPDGWTTFGQPCYYFTHSTTMSFVESEHYCRQHDGHLVHVNDAAENSFLKDHLSRLVDQNFWIGLSDDVIEGVFKWTGTDTEAEFTDWLPGEPNNSAQIEDCAYFTADSWNDLPCNRTIQAICEIEMAETSSGLSVG